MPRISWVVLLAAVMLVPASARSQIFVGQGSTVQGDYLRGAGIAAWGMGQYNLNTARADRIEAETSILVYDYLSACRKEENARQARIRAQHLADRLKFYKQHRDQLRFAPERVDILSGNALNDVLEFLSQGRFTPSVLDSTPVPISVDLVRQVPFSLGEKGQLISLSRMMHRGNTWPVAFQDKRFAKAKQKYDRAMNKALDESMQEKIQGTTIKEVIDAIEGLSTQLVALENQLEITGFKEAIAHLSELRKIPIQLDTKKVQQALVVLDSYSGTTVQDLRKFMNDHGLRFAPAEWPTEKKAYRELYPALKLQGEGLGLFAKEQK